MNRSQTWSRKAAAYGYPGAIAGLLLLVGCSESHDDWYDKTKTADQERTAQIESLKAQGLDDVRAAREVDLQGYTRATEQGDGVPPLQGNDLQNALNSDKSGQRQ